jgi:uncharacterized protein YggT (Ycf19 family)
MEVDFLDDQRTNTNSEESTVETTRTVQTIAGAPLSAPAVPKQTVAVRVVWYLAGILLILLAFRFVLALLGANSVNPFAHFIYAVSYPFVAPFFSLFGYRLTYGVSQVEIFTLVAMGVYAVIAWGLDKLLSITRA